MSRDLVVLTSNTPTIHDIVDGMAAVGEELRVRRAGHGAVMQLCDIDERPLVSIEAPLWVQVPGEAERVLGRLGAEQIAVPVSWLEVRAARRQPAVELARTFAADVAARLGGVVWPARSGGMASGEIE